MLENRELRHETPRFDIPFSSIAAIETDWDALDDNFVERELGDISNLSPLNKYFFEVASVKRDKSSDDEAEMYLKSALFTTKKIKDLPLSLTDVTEFDTKLYSAIIVASVDDPDWHNPLLAEAFKLVGITPTSSFYEALIIDTLPVESPNLDEAMNVIIAKYSDEDLLAELIQGYADAWAMQFRKYQERFDSK